MTWFSDIFSSASDQARLATTLIAAAIAILVVLLNQRFNSRKARKDKLIEKLEELHKVILREHKFIRNLGNITDKIEPTESSHSASFISEIAKNVKINIPKLNIPVENAASEDISELLIEANMLAGLYFPTIVSSIDRLANSHQGLRHELSGNSENLDWGLIKQLQKGLEADFKRVFEELQLLMHDTMH